MVNSIETGEIRTHISGVSWRTYASLLEDWQNRSTPRLTFDHGELEIVSPLKIHEKSNQLLATIAEIYFEVFGIEFDNLGALTLRRETTERGTEPDTCFYISNLDRIREAATIDLDAGDPAPDLVIEIDVTSPSVSKLPLYFQFGVREIWRWQNSAVTILCRQENTFAAQPESSLLARVTAADLTRFVGEGQQSGRLAWQRSVRAWITSLQSSDEPAAESV